MKPRQQKEYQIFALEGLQHSIQKSPSYLLVPVASVQQSRSHSHGEGLRNIGRCGIIV